MCLYFRPEDAKEGMYYISSGRNGVDLSYMNRKFKIKIRNSINVWELMMSQLETNKWYFIEITWSEESGVKLYVNNKLIEGDKYPAGKSVRIFSYCITINWMALLLLVTFD